MCIRLREGDGPRLLVVLGVREYGEKELLAIEYCTRWPTRRPRLTPGLR